MSELFYKLIKLVGLVQLKIAGNTSAHRAIGAAAAGGQRTGEHVIASDVQTASEHAAAIIRCADAHSDADSGRGGAGRHHDHRA